MNFKERINNLNKTLEGISADAILINNIANVRYLTGFLGSSADILISPNNKNYFFTDGRYIEDVQDTDIPKFYEVIETKNLLKSLVAILKKENIRKLVIETDTVTLHQRNLLKQAVSDYKIRLINRVGLVMSLRECKSLKEVEIIKEAIDVAENVYKDIEKMIKDCDITLSEYDIAIELEYKIRKSGCSVAFEPIVASGYNSIKPHARPTSKKIQPNEFIIIDFGVLKHSYNCDITRTLIRDPDKQKKELYNAINNTVKETISYLKPGVKISFLYERIKDLLLQYQFINSSFLKHNFGHGIGLEVHESPAIAENTTKILRDGMVITIEPGIYIKDIGGVRIEEMVYIKDDSCTILTQNLPLLHLHANS